MSSEDFGRLLDRVTDHLKERHYRLNDVPTLASAGDVQRTISALPATLPEQGMSTEAAMKLVQDKIVTGLLQGQTGPHYFGFVVGGVTEPAQLAEVLLSSYDENAGVTAPCASAGPALEVRTLELLLDLLALPRTAFLGRTLTTGATASNILGLGCARDHLYATSPHLPRGFSYAQSGPPTGVNLPSPPIVVLALHPHYSIMKAAAVVGLGSGPDVLQTMPCQANDELAFDLAALEDKLRKEKEAGRGVILCYGLGEVNTGGFGSGLPEVAKLCKDYGAWLHIDAAFGGFAAVVPEFRRLTQGMELADSLTLDGHKWLNVPYDCGIFYTKARGTLPGLLGPPASSLPAYLAAPPSAEDGEEAEQPIPPLYLNLESSRRLRALPVFCSLIALGKDGYVDIVRRNVMFARQVAEYIHGSEAYELMNYTPGWTPGSNLPIVPLNIAMFRPSPSVSFPPVSDHPPGDTEAGSRLTSAINTTRRIYVTGTRWRGLSATRLCVSNWRTGLGDELETVKKVLESVSQLPNSHSA